MKRMTFDEMVDKDVLNQTLHHGFIIGRGKVIFWHFSPTPNGFYRVYPQYPNGELGRPRYIDGTKTKVTIIPK